MIGSIFGIILGGNNSSDVTYTNSDGEIFKFSSSQEGYYLYKSSFGDVIFFNYPSQLEDMEFPVFPIINSGELILLFDPSNEVSELAAIDQIQRQIIVDLSNLGKIVSQGISKESILYSELPIHTCETSPGPILYFQNSLNYSIESNANCTIIKGNTNDFYRVRDLLLFSQLNIIK